MTNKDKEVYYGKEINRALAAIENITKVMAHEDDRIKSDMDKYYNGDMLPIVFYTRVMKYWDELQGIKMYDR